MYNHAPKEYECPICIGVGGIENDATLIRQSDIVYKDDFVMAFISSFFVGKNEGHVIIVPKEHFENLYDLPEKIAHAIVDLSKKVALAVRESYHADGVTIQQNNEPAGGQHAFHYHMHVFPRYKDDMIYQHMYAKKSTTALQRLPYATKLKTYFKQHYENIY